MKWIGVIVFTLLCLMSTIANSEEEFCPPVAVRLMSYGAYQESAWTHLPSIGVKYLFMAVPTADQVAEVMKKLNEHNLKVLVLRGEADITQDNCIQQLEDQFKVCSQMGVHYLFLSAKRKETPKEVVYERLRKAGDVAEKYDVTLVLETHPDLGTNGDVQIETMKAINHPRVRVNFDTANITYYNQNTDAVTELKKSVPYVATVEFKDHTGEYETWNFPPLGQGKVNFPEIVKILKEHHYNGPITIEFEGVKGVELNEQQIKDAIETSVKYVHSIGCFK
ncbi:MAG TPA: sugar phosphate isomerase/epimerase family protein [Candidatus Hydrogenedens sp.]|nr:sugar phosphate isomerase/epimerase [Candidatus Hydrogenedens sp.]HOK10535.1 sugar phosphate isomerase/epimerase family protein [Candidatus Hydrogenedens sp.]HOL20087.1 sugar phosphate isomerase/epimerase family protein [Candidatus Hydrogenedens sp.]HPP60037.1 sugar phosphate isomerase/epimerase family protein [Candidatus Hydrogenedens sp.]